MDTDGRSPLSFDGAVDLNHPIQQAGRAFLSEMARGGKCATFIGIDSAGRSVMTHYAPGGLLEVLGLAMLGAMTVLHQQQHSQQPQQQPRGTA